MTLQWCFLDSAVTAAVAVKKTLPAFLHVNYGQRTEKKELECFNAIADYFGIEKRLVVETSHLSRETSHLSRIGGSALTDKGIEVPGGKLSRSVIPATYVPFRNANLLSVAVSWAEVLGAGRGGEAVSIYIGAVEEDSSGYPDCRRDFFGAFERAVELGTRPETRIRIETPLIDLRKSEIVRLGVELKAPFHLTWSCYRDTDVACGECDSCLLRLRGFKEAGVQDPIAYGKNGKNGKNRERTVET
jgi:7-cyano-7-deazaguanine synthase